MLNQTLRLMKEHTEAKLSGEGCGYEWAWVGWNSGRSMRVSDSIPVLNQVRFVVVLGVGGVSHAAALQ